MMSSRSVERNMLKLKCLSTRLDFSGRIQGALRFRIRLRKKEKSTYILKKYPRRIRKSRSTRINKIKGRNQTKTTRSFGRRRAPCRVLGKSMERNVSLQRKSNLTDLLLSLSP